MRIASRRQAVVVGLLTVAFWGTTPEGTKSVAAESDAGITALQGKWKVYREESAIGIEADTGHLKIMINASQ